MDENYNNNTPENEENSMPNEEAGQTQENAAESIPNEHTGQQTYTDPNAEVQAESSPSGEGQQTIYGNPGAGTQDGTYGNPNVGQQQYQNTNYQARDNYAYNVGNNTGYNHEYNDGYDTTPMSMGDWALTILALMIPCVGVILYFIWAFGKSGNINRRNYCRVMLIVWAVEMVLCFVVLGFVMAAVGTSVY